MSSDGPVRLWTVGVGVRNSWVRQQQVDTREETTKRVQAVNEYNDSYEWD